MWLFATGGLALTTDQGGSSDQDIIEHALRAVANGNDAQSDLSVSYDDMHGLWGGMTITITGAGRYRLVRRARGAGSAEVVEGSLDRQQLRHLASLLVALRAWEQETPERAPVPDESRAYLATRVANAEVVVWEWYNDLAKNRRLIQARDKMRDMVKPVEPRPPN